MTYYLFSNRKELTTDVFNTTNLKILYRVNNKYTKVYIL